RGYRVEALIVPDIVICASPHLDSSIIVSLDIVSFHYTIGRASIEKEAITLSLSSLIIKADVSLEGVFGAVRVANTTYRPRVLPVILGQIIADSSFCTVVEQHA